MERRGERQVVLDIVAGDANAYAILVKRYQRPIYNLMLRMTSAREDAFDLTQDAFVRAYEKLEKFIPSRPFFPWLYSIGLNLARDHLRRNRAREANSRLLENESHNPGTGEEVNELLAAIDARRVGKALEELPLEFREALILRFHEGLAMKEVGQALGLTTSGAKMRVHRGLRALRQRLDAGGQPARPC